MDALTTHTGIAVPMDVSNIDTDQLLPAEFLKRITRTGFEDGLFASWRADPDFVLNDPTYAEASVLVAGEDFGTGSSREHAVWALQDWGFRVVISSRFGDIFRSNAGKSGLLAARVEPADADLLLTELAAAPGSAVTVDLEAKQIRLNGLATIDFEIDDYTRWRLLNGLDDISITLQSSDAIADYERRRPSFTPTLSAG
ncbi:3-isopropylmalate dehydratase small subunit [Planococcus sp. APC 4015]|nr:3-isopropylmalate dehydratase small subunit [Planococcus sp. APC 4015]